MKSITLLSCCCLIILGLLGYFGAAFLGTEESLIALIPSGIGLLIFLINIFIVPFLGKIQILSLMLTLGGLIYAANELIASGFPEEESSVQIILLASLAIYVLLGLDLSINIFKKDEDS